MLNKVVALIILMSHNSYTFSKNGQLRKVTK